MIVMHQSERQVNIRQLHRFAMQLVDDAIAARMQGNSAQADDLRRQALAAESEAAYQLAVRHEAEPTRSILFKGAAVLALECQSYREAEKLIATALAGDPPNSLANELRDLLEQAQFHRHLDLHGIELRANEFQLVISGDEVGRGIAMADCFVGRVQDAERLVYRTVERLQKLPFRETGRVRKDIKNRYPLFVTTPRDGSFAVTCRLGTPKLQGSLPGLDPAIEIVDDVMECLALLQRDAVKELSDAIPDEAYRRNFIGLARRLAPDGKAVKLVGITTIRDGVERRLELTGVPNNGLAPKPDSTSGKQSRPPVSVTGELTFARKGSQTEGRIKLVEPSGKGHLIIVPEGMMSDIVKPHWEEVVTVTGIRTSRGIMLGSIRPAEDASWTEFTSAQIAVGS